MTDLIDIDWERLHQISEADPEFELELLTMLAEDVKIHIDDLRQAVTDGNIDAIAHESHYIKGSSANVGVRPIAALAKQIEQFAREGASPANSAPLVAEMAVELDRLVTFLSSN